MSKKPKKYHVKTTREIVLGWDGGDWELAIQNDGDLVVLGSVFPDGKKHAGSFTVIVPPEFARLIAESLAEMADYVEGVE